MSRACPFGADGCRAYFAFFVHDPQTVRSAIEVGLEMVAREPIDIERCTEFVTNVCFGAFEHLR